MVVIRIMSVQCNCLDVVGGRLILEKSDFYGIYEVDSGVPGGGTGAYLGSNCDGLFRIDPFQARCEVSDKLRRGGIT